MENELGRDRVLEGAIPGRVGNDLGGVRLRNALGSGLEVPVVSPLMRSEAVGEKLYQAWPESLAKTLVGGVTGWANKFPEKKGDKTDVERAYEIASPAMFATSKFKSLYPTFEVYAAKMKDMGIPLDLLGKQKAKGFYKEVPANEAEYLARAGKEDWSSIKSAIDSIPKHKAGGLDLLTDLRAKFPEMPKSEFDEMVLGLSREGKISLHHHDMPGSYKGEMIKDGDTYYHAFGVKPDWR
jgi:hypothetical protein